MIVAEQTLAEHNVVATFTDDKSVRLALEELEREGVSEERISFLAREAEEVAGRSETMADESQDAPGSVVAGIAGGGAAGAAGGGLVGFVAGAIAFGIPGIGPAVGTGIWAATAGGAVAGATAGGVAGGISRMWKERYEDAVREGQLVLGVHTPDEQEAATAATVLTRHDPEQIDRYDSDGRLQSSTPLSSKDDGEVSDDEQS